MFALTLASAKQIAIAIVVVLVVIALVTAKVMSSVTKKAVALVIFAALALGVWTQRQSLQKCADDVRSSNRLAPATCHFFGNDITIVPPLDPAPVGG